MNKTFTTKNGKIGTVRISAKDETGEAYARQQIRDALKILNMTEDIEGLCENDIIVSVGKNSLTAPVLAELWDRFDMFLSEFILFWIDDYSLDIHYPYYHDLAQKLKASLY